MNVKTLDFIGIGAAKSGTTSLFYYLREHPGIFMPANKEAPYFSNEERFSRGWEAYAHDFFDGAPPDAVWGKITPRYMGDVMVPKRLHASMPQVRLFALLRNPIDRALSKHRLVGRRRPQQADFESMVARQLEPEALRRGRTEHLPLPDTLVVRGEYARILKGYLSYFPRRQLLVFFTEDLKERPQFVLDSILEHIGLQAGFTPGNLGKKYYVGGDRQRFPGLVPALRKVPTLEKVWKSLPSDQRRRFFLWFMRQVNVVRAKPLTLPSPLRRELVDFYLPDVVELEALLGREVPWAEFRERISGGSSRGGKNAGGRTGAGANSRDSSRIQG